MKRRIFAVSRRERAGAAVERGREPRVPRGGGTDAAAPERGRRGRKRRRRGKRKDGV